LTAETWSAVLPVCQRPTAGDRTPRSAGAHAAGRTRVEAARVAGWAGRGCVGWAAGRRAVGGEGAWVAHGRLPLDVHSTVQKPKHLLHPAVLCRAPHLPPTVRHGRGLLGAPLAAAPPHAFATSARRDRARVAISIGHLRVRRSQEVTHQTHPPKRLEPPIVRPDANGKRARTAHPPTLTHAERAELTFRRPRLARAARAPPARRTSQPDVSRCRR